ncbi:hypothetical protein [Curtobacterium sp. MCBD17_023]|nr:hypothetical protein [Curtobacterium sp. MCBD17_023]
MARKSDWSWQFGTFHLDGAAQPKLDARWILGSLQAGAMLAA